MKILLKILPVVVMTALALVVFGLQGVAGQGKSKEKERSQAKENAQSKAALTQARHLVALKALDDRHFVIRAEQIFFPYGRSNGRNVGNGCLISMQGTRAVLEYDYTVFVHARWGIQGRTGVFHDDLAQITEGKLLPNGDTQYTLTMKHNGDDGIVALAIFITVHHGGDKCTVRVDSNRNNTSSPEVVTIKGVVLALATGELKGLVL